MRSTLKEGVRMNRRRHTGVPAGRTVWARGRAGERTDRRPVHVGRRTG